MSVIIGIDLGTSTTEAAVYREGKKEIIPNPEGAAITPSAVGIDASGNWVVGERAKAQFLLSPGNTAIEVKRKTGTGEQIQLGGAKYTPVELQAKLLSYVRTYASEYLGEDVTHAVISVPAYFNEIQRRETLQAGELAGFSVERILNEPTAAALSYGLDHMEEESHVLVYDLGGGTFDVTLLEMFDGVLEVKASSGDNQLGGKDFDEILMEELYRRFQEKHGKDLRQDRGAAVRIKEEAEKCKIALSEADRCQILIPAICTLEGTPVELDETITRERFEALAVELLRRTHPAIDVVLEDAGLTEEDIDLVILVGGSTRMPMVRQDILRYLDKEPSASVHPEYAVAEGAAIQAAIISGEIRPEDGLVMTDVNPYTLGIRTVSFDSADRMAVVIPRNVTIPVTRKDTFQTCVDWQTQAEIAVYQGESMLASHNHFLGSFTVTGIPSKPAMEEEIEVQFAYDLNGILTVTATLRSTGKEASIQINMAGDQKEAVDLSQWKQAKGAKAYRTVIRTAERSLSQSGTLPPTLCGALQVTLDELKTALIQGRPEEAAAAGGRLEELLENARSLV